MIPQRTPASRVPSTSLSDSSGSGRARAWRRRRPTLEAMEARLLMAYGPSEFPLRYIGGNSDEIAPDSTGRLWFTMDSNTVGMVDPSSSAGVVQYTIPTNNSGPGPIVASPDGSSMWFFEENANQFGVINTTTGAITEIPFLATNAPNLKAMVDGPDGNIWFTEYNSSKIGSINPTTLKVAEYPTPTTAAQPYGIAVGPDGNIWFTEAGADNIGVLNLKTFIPTEFAIPTTTGGVTPLGITLGPDNKLWFTESATNTNKIGSFNAANYDPANPAPSFNSYAVKTAAAVPTEIVSAGGRLWYSEGTLTNRHGQVGVIDPGNTGATKTEVGNPVDLGSVLGVARGSDGNVWFTSPNSPVVGTVYTSQAMAPTVISYPATDPPTNTHTVDYTPLGLDASPYWVLNGPDGKVWFDQPGENQFGVLDTTSHQSTEYQTLPTASIPEQMIVGQDGDVWVTLYGGRFNDGTRGLAQIDGNTHAIIKVNPVTTGDPYGIVQVPDGDFWITDQGNSEILRMTPGGASRYFTIPTANPGPNGITVDNSGVVWFTEGNANRIGRVDPANPTVTDYPIPSLRSNPAPNQIVAAPGGGTLWFSDGTNEIGSFTPGSPAPRFTMYPLAAGITPYGLTFGPDGNLWFTDSGKVGVFSVTTHQVLAEYNTVSAPEGFITAGPDGNIWYTGEQTLVRNSNYLSTLGEVSLTSATIPTQLAITTPPPPSVNTGRGFGLVVSVENATGGLTTDINGTVTLSLGSNPNGETLGGTLTATISNGQALFSGLTLNKAGLGTTIQATFGGLTTAITPAIKVTNPATKLVVLTQPPSTIPENSSFGLSVVAEDALNNVDTAYTGVVVVALGNNPAFDTLGGTLAVNAVNGVATFSGLTLTKPAQIVNLKLVSYLLSSATSNAFNVTVAANQLVVMTQPPLTVTAGSPFDVAFQAEDSAGAIDTTKGGSATVAIVQGTGVNGATFGGTLTEPFVNGVADFPDLTLDKTGNGYQIAATSTGLASATTFPLNVAATAANHLVITTQPSAGVTAGGQFSIIVSAEDRYNNVGTTFNGPASIAIAAGSGVFGATLSGTLNATFNAGVATFNALGLDKAGSGYILQVTNPTLGNVATTPFPVTPGVVTQLAVSSPPIGTIVAGTPFEVDIVAQDIFHNAVTSFNGPVTLSIGTGPTGAKITGSSLIQSAVSGHVAFGGLVITKAGSYTIQAANPQLTRVVTPTFTLLAGTPTMLGILTQPPGRVPVGRGFGLTVAAEDKYGNPNSTDTGLITLALSPASNPSGATLNGVTKVTAGAGGAVFAGVSLSKPGVNDILQATSSDNLTPATTSAVTAAEATADFNGDGLSDVGIYQPNTGLFALAALNPGTYSIGLQFFPRLNAHAGQKSVPITGDFNGDGLGDIGLYFPALDLFELGILNAQGQITREIDIIYGYHDVGVDAIPVTGDWSGSGITGIGAYLPDKDIFNLGVLDSQGKVAQQIVNLSYGYHTKGVYSIPITGDWSGNGTTGVGVYIPADDKFALTVLSPGQYKVAQQIVATFGTHDNGQYSIPVTGDWSGNGTTGVGVYLPADDTFMLAVLNPGTYTVGQSVNVPYGYHDHGAYSVPVTGDWSGSGRTGVGIYLPADDIFALGLLSPGTLTIAPQQIKDRYGFHTPGVFAAPIPVTRGQPGGISSGVGASALSSGSVSALEIPGMATSPGGVVAPAGTSPPSSSAIQTTVTIRRRVVPQDRATRRTLSELPWVGGPSTASERG